MDEKFYADDTLGGRLLAARESAGLSLNTAAERLGVAPLTLRNWECDRAEPTAQPRPRARNRPLIRHSSGHAGQRPRRAQPA